MERWVSINNAPDYEVSDKGRIRNSKTGRIIKTRVNKRGYENVCLHNNGNRITTRVHRIVAENFYDGNHDGYDVNHIDGNKVNNSVDNLEWCTRKENIAHAYRTGLKKEPDKVKVRVVETGEEYDSLVACSRAIGGDRCQIHRCLLGKERTCKGFHFELIEEAEEEEA